MKKINIVTGVSEGLINLLWKNLFTVGIYILSTLEIYVLKLPTKNVTPTYIEITLAQFTLILFLPDFIDAVNIYKTYTGSQALI